MKPQPASVADEAAERRRPNAWHSRGYLPHFDRPGLVQFITFRLYDSVPVAQVQLWKDQLNWGEGLFADDPICAELRQRIDLYEDMGHGECFLKDLRVCAVVAEALRHFDGTRYRLLEWCVMPNHVHTLIEIMPGYEVRNLVHSWKSFTATAANKLLGRAGRFWMREYFDRYIRDQKHYLDVIGYIRNQGGGVVAGSFLERS